MTDTSITKRVARKWRSACLLVGFHRNRAGVRREKPFFWSPDKAHAGIGDDPQHSETVCVVSSVTGNRDEDVQIKLHPDKIVLRRGQEDCWTGIIVTDTDVQVQVAGKWIRIGHDGRVELKTDLDTTSVEADGSVLKELDGVWATMSGDGSKISSSTEHVVSSISPRGVLQKIRGGSAKPDR